MKEKKKQDSIFWKRGFTWRGIAKFELRPRSVTSLICEKVILPFVVQKPATFKQGQLFLGITAAVSIGVIL
jgi:hypothetical protein